ncbi:MAG: PLDc N-terminal domain-containing protein [Betaproteobacteria bacterium]|nr:PLDc N-terminal domain-containing protein [Betaproteobacteria bacterium]
MDFSLLTLLHVAVLLAVALRLFSRRNTNGSALAWLLLVILVPVVGVVMYLLIGERRLGRTWMRRAIAMQPQVLEWARGIPAASLSAPDSLAPGAQGICRLASGAVGMPLMAGHRLQLLPDSESSMQALIADIDAATASVHTEFYIWSAGGFVDDFVAALTRAAQRGVACSALMDSLGSRPFFKSESVARLRAAGVKVVEVLPVNPLRALFVRFDLRDHRKIAVIDRRIAYTGSMNIADPRFFKQDAGVGEWVDAMVRVEGPAAWALEAVSLSLTARRPAPTSRPRPARPAARRLQPGPDFPQWSAVVEPAHRAVASGRDLFGPARSRADHALFHSERGLADGPAFGGDARRAGGADRAGARGLDAGALCRQCLFQRPAGSRRRSAVLW